MRSGRLVLTLGVFCAPLAGALQDAQAPPPGPFQITRTAHPVQIDGNLDDEAWKGALKLEQWFETNPGDNTPPKARNVGYLLYDDRYLYAAFEFDDPNPKAIRAPFSDRDNINGDTDYGGLILNPRNDGRTGLLLLANPRGIQYDAVNDDATGNEDNSPDFFWDSAARLTERGWTLEIRVPFTSLRYPRTDPATWRVMLYRNYPREYRYQFFTSTLPRGGNCFICRSPTLEGLVGLPKGGSLVAAPYVNGQRTQIAPDGAATPLGSGKLTGDIGGDLKWTPSASTAVDATLNPDFSQIESDTAQIAVNERFALFFPEKRPFFLEGVEQFGTPIQAVYTRTLTAPLYGARATGKFGSTAFTALAVQDEGGGSVLLPNSNSSDFADQDFRSWAAIARVRRDVKGSSFVSLLGTARVVEGGGHNVVGGPDFQLRTARENITGQLLLSDTTTPVRPDLTAQWDGRRLAGHAGSLSWSHNTRHHDAYAQYQDIADDFRADNGFVPQVGFREAYGETGYTFRPQGFLRRLRTFAIAVRSQDREDRLITQQLSLGSGMDGRFNSFARVNFAWERVQAGATELPRRRLYYQIDANPSRRISQLSFRGNVGEQVDFAGARVGWGASVVLTATVRPTDHLALAWYSERRWLDVPPVPNAARERLFTATVQRLRTTYTFSSRAYARLIGQYVDTRRDVELAGSGVPHTAAFSGSLLFAYKLNWQTVLFLGYGDERELDAVQDELKPVSRQAFVKLSYAFQR